MKSKYILQKTDKSFCKYCNNKVSLLCHFSDMISFASFYICFKCKKVFEIGKGEVKKDN